MSDSGSFAGASVMEGRDTGLRRTADSLMKEKRFRKAHEVYLHLANQGDPYAQLYVGWMNLEGVGVPRDKKLAYQWFTQAASLGSAPAAFYCGRAALRDSEWAEAIRWFQHAIEKEYGPALLWMGLIFIRGYGVPIDRAKGVAYLKRGAATGNYYARGQLALQMIRGSLGVKQIPSGLLLLVCSVAAAIAQHIKEPRDERLLA